MSFNHEFLKKAFPQINTELGIPKTTGEKNPARDLISRLDTAKNRNKEHLLGSLVLDKHALKPKEIPQSQIDIQRRIARELGHGEISVGDDQLKSELAKQQVNSLKKWVDYLASPDALYDTAFKYFVLRSVTKLAADGSKRITPTDYHESLSKVIEGKRSKPLEPTVKEFPTLNTAALAKVQDVLLTDKAELEKTAQDAKNSNNFWKLYEYALIKIQEEQLALTLEKQEGSEGTWKKFDQGSDPSILSLAVRGTGWCTEGVEMATSQLEQGDFHVYFTNNKNGIPTVPRIAIRMAEGSIAEVRGTNPGQEMEPEMVDVVSSKMKEFPDGVKYEKKVSDMKNLTQIVKKQENEEALTQEEIKFLWEVGNTIEGFSYDGGEDPRVYNTRKKRNFISDIKAVIDVIDPRLLKAYKQIILCNNIQTKKYGTPLTNEELSFIWEVDEPVEEYPEYEAEGWYAIREVREHREQRNDLAKLFNCDPKLIALEPEDINQDTIYIDRALRHWMARDEKTEASELKKLSLESDVEIRVEVAKNKNTPIDVFRVLSKDTSYLVRQEVAKNNSTTPELINEMALNISDDKEQDTVLYWILTSSKVSQEVLEKYSNANPYLKRAVATNPKTSPEILTTLYSEEETHQVLATNPHTPPETLIKLANSANGYTSQLAKTNPNFPKDIQA
jgi:hypothetical protein